MPDILIYLLKVNIALLLFCLGYYLVLRRLTFYTLNRVYLITAILFSSLYPLIDLSGIMQRHEKLVEPIQLIVITLNTKATQLAEPVAQTNYWQWLVWLFWTGVGIMATRLAIQFISLWKIYRRSKFANLYNFKVRVINEEANPFSFWQSIYINPKQHDDDELRSIIAHEQVHVNQWHTLDILLAELSLVFYWFNPGVWLMKKAVAENLEFITDRQILKQGIDAKSYQYSLLYASFNTSPNAIVNHFNISTIKKRIMMMNSKKSSAFSLTRYGFIAPAVLVLLLVFGTTKAEFVKKQLKRVNQITNAAIGNIKVDTALHVAPTTLALSHEAIKPLASKKMNIISNKDSIKLQRTDAIKVKLQLGKIAGADSVIYVIDGKEVTKAEVDKLNPNFIESVHILKDAEALKLFGSDKDKGRVIIITKAGMNTPEVKKFIEKYKLTAIGKKPTVNVGATFKFEADPAPTGYYTPAGTDKKIPVYGDEKQIIAAIGTPHQPATINGSVSTGKIQGQATFSVTDDKTNLHRADTSTNAITVNEGHTPLYLKGMTNDPLFILNGKEITKPQFDKLDQSKLESVQIYKDKVYTNKYGEKGLNGVVILTTKSKK
jgi:bla regulator protein BlaR1